MCPSCLDGAHGDCLLWKAPDCECSCIKRCHQKHPGESLRWISCDQPVGHLTHHRYTIEWVNEALPGWGEIAANVRALKVKPEAGKGDLRQE